MREPIRPVACVISAAEGRLCARTSSVSTQVRVTANVQVFEKNPIVESLIPIKGVIVSRAALFGCQAVSRLIALNKVA